MRHLLLDLGRSMRYDLRQFLYVLYQTTRASYLAQEKNSSLGLIWHLLNPLFMTAVLFGVFSNVQRLSEIENYQLFILIGVVHYNFFINSSTRSSQFFKASRSLVLNTIVPVEMLVLRQICIEGLTLLIEILLVLVLGLFFGANLTQLLLLYPLVFIGLLALSLGASLFLCSLSIFLTDLTHIWGIFCRLLFFLTPVFFDPEIVGDGKARFVLELNPLTGLITFARECLLYGRGLDVPQILTALGLSLAVLLFGMLVFRAVRPRIPDFI